ncbi:zinc finger, CCHC-type containing protein, partial [Tanacetum coccineum]
MKVLRLDDKLNFVEEPIEIMDHEVKHLRQSRIPIVKVRWNSKRGPEFMWEREDQIRAKKLKVDGTIEKFKARLVIQGFKQKSGIDYFDTYALVACMGTIRLLIAMALIHNLIIHQMDMKTAFLNGDLDEEVDLTKEFLSSRFFMKDMGESDVILGIRIKHESNGITISQSYYIKKVLKKFNYFDCTPVSTSMDTSEKLMPNNGQDVSQLEYSRMIGCLMYA